MADTFMPILRRLLVAASLGLAGCASSDGFDRPAGRLSTNAQQSIANANPSALIRIADSFREAGDYASAYRLYGQAAGLQPDNPAPLIGMAHIHVIGEEWSRAATFYREALTIDPLDPTANEGLAWIFIQQERPEAALAQLNDPLSRGVRTTSLLNLKGLALDLMGKHAEARSYYSKGLEGDPDNSAVLTNLALSFASEGSYAAAIKILQDLSDDPYAANRSREALVLIYAASGQPRMAMQIAQTVFDSQYLAANSPFYMRLSDLQGAELARALFLGKLPARQQAAQQQSVPSVADGVQEEQDPAGRVDLAMVEAGAEDNSTQPVSSQPSDTARTIDAESSSAEIQDEAGPTAEKTPDDTVNSPAGRATEIASEIRLNAASAKALADSPHGLLEEDMVEVAPAGSPEVQDDRPVPADPEPETVDIDGGADPEIDIVDHATGESGRAKPEAPADAFAPIPAQNEDANAQPGDNRTPSATIEAAEADTEPEINAGTDSGQVNEQTAAGAQYRIQLGAFRRFEGPRRGWQQLTEAHPDLLTGHTAIARLVEIDPEQSVHRLLIDGFVNFSDAQALCDALSDRGVGCVVVPDDGPPDRTVSAGKSASTLARDRG